MSPATATLERHSETADKAAETTVDRVRTIAAAELPKIVEAIDEGLNPAVLMRDFGKAGAWAGHMPDADAPDLGAAIQCMAAMGEYCGATSFIAWCQDTLAWYVGNADNVALKDRFAAAVSSGQILGGTGLSNPMKTFFGIETLKLKGRRVPTSTEVPMTAVATFPVDPAAGRILIDAKAMMSALGSPKIAILDVRDVDEWIGESSSPYGKDFCPRMGRIPRAKWIEWYRMMKPTSEGPRFKSKNEIMAECSTVGITADTPVYLYCFKGARASNTFLALTNARVKDVRMYFGSWNEWSRDNSYPIEEGLPKPYVEVPATAA